MYINMLKTKDYFVQNQVYKLITEGSGKVAVQNSSGRSVIKTNGNIIDTIILKQVSYILKIEIIIHIKY